MVSDYSIWRTWGPSTPGQTLEVRCAPCSFKCVGRQEKAREESSSFLHFPLPFLASVPDAGNSQPPTVGVFVRTPGYEHGSSLFTGRFWSLLQGLLFRFSLTPLLLPPPFIFPSFFRLLFFVFVVNRGQILYNRLFITVDLSLRFLLKHVERSFISYSHHLDTYLDI